MVPLDTGRSADVAPWVAGLLRQADDEAAREVARRRIAETESKRLRDALDALAEASERFSTEADYTIEQGTEEDFVAALDDARRALGMTGERP